MSERALAAASESGLIVAGEPLLVMLSGGADSVCLLDCAVTLGAKTSALHVNYGLRGEASDSDERHCRALCERLGVPLVVERVQLPDAGNLQAEARGLEWVEDASNADPRFARARVREEVLPALRQLNPAAEHTIVETSRLLRDEAEVLDAAVDEAVKRLGKHSSKIAELRALPPGLARLVLRRLAETASGGSHSLSRERADEILHLGERGGTASLDLGDGLRAVAEYGTLRFTRDPDAPPPEPAKLLVPGSARFGDWEVSAAIGEGGEALLAAERLGVALTVRAWHEGDRMRPAGLGGSKTLQDLFTDRKVPRALRHRLPVVTTEQGEIVWVAGVAIGESFKATAHEKELVSLSARQVP